MIVTGLILLSSFSFYLPNLIFAQNERFFSRAPIAKADDVVVKDKEETEVNTEEKDQEEQALVRTKEEIKSQAKSRLTEIKKRSIRVYFAFMLRRFKAAISRMKTLLVRIQSRLEKIKTEDSEIDTIAVEDKIKQIQLDIDTSEQLLKEAESSIEAVLTNEDPKTAFGPLKEKMKKIKNDLVNIRQELVKLIGEIKGLRVGQNESLPTVLPTTS